MIEKIKNQFKKVVIPVFISIVFGALCGHLVYTIYDDELSIDLNDNLVYLIQSGAYSTYDNMRANTMGNYIYYEDDGLFKTIIGITKSKENVDKIKLAYGKDVVVNEYYIDNENLCNQIKEYDKKLNKVNDADEIQKITVSMLDLYKDVENIKLSKID